MDKYNYQHFDPKNYDLIHFLGPKAGEKYIDFEATTLAIKVLLLGGIRALYEFTIGLPQLLGQHTAVDKQMDK